jgi:hypothetical protein
MACCTLDVTLNAITIHWVTNRGKGRQNTERSTVNRRGGRGVNSPSQQYGVGVGVGADKQVGPLESHISVTVESYVEEYHQLHYGGSSSQHY